MEEKNPPEKKFTAGPISASVWLNKATRPNGEESVFKTVTLQRGYKDRNGNWQNTQTLRANDLPKAVLVLDKAYEYIIMSGEKNEQG